MRDPLARIFQNLNNPSTEAFFMYTHIAKLIEQSKISYEDVEKLVNSQKIKNLFLARNNSRGDFDGAFEKIEKEKLKDRFINYCETQLESAKTHILNTKNRFKEKLWEYRAYYRKLKEKFSYLDGQELIQECQKELKELMRKDKDNFEHLLTNFRNAKREYKNEEISLNQREKVIKYYSLFVYTYEYEKAKLEYMKEILESA